MATNEFDNCFPVGRIVFNSSDTNMFGIVPSGVFQEKQKTEIERLNETIEELRDEIRILTAKVASLQKGTTYYLNIPGKTTDAR